jgi:hypothetical protein
MLYYKKRSFNDLLAIVKETELFTEKFEGRRYSIEVWGEMYGKNKAIFLVECRRFFKRSAECFTVTIDGAIEDMPELQFWAIEGWGTGYHYPHSSKASATLADSYKKKPFNDLLETVRKTKLFKDTYNGRQYTYKVSGEMYGESKVIILIECSRFFKKSVECFTVTSDGVIEDVSELQFEAIEGRDAECRYPRSSRL